jgi:hypothetical protein
MVATGLIERLQQMLERLRFVLFSSSTMMVQLFSANEMVSLIAGEESSTTLIDPIEL